MAAFAAAVAVLAAGCTHGPSAGTDPGGAGSRGAAPGSALSATVSGPDGPVAVAQGSTAGALSIAVSRQLFDAAPVVVVAAAEEPASIASAASQAERLGVPLLLAGGAASPVPAASPSGGRPRSAGPPDTLPAGPRDTLSGGSPDASSSGPTRSPAEELRGEIGRLRPRAVLAVGATVGSRLAALPGGVGVISDPAALPAVAPPSGLADLAVLVPVGGDTANQAGARAAAATARAAGASVVPVRGD